MGQTEEFAGGASKGFAIRKTKEFGI